MRGDLILLAVGRDPDVRTEFLPSEAEAKRRVKRFREIKEEEGYEISKVSKPNFVIAKKEDRQDHIAYYLFDPTTFQRRWNKELLPHMKLRKDLRPNATL